MKENSTARAYAAWTFRIMLALAVFYVAWEFYNRYADRRAAEAAQAAAEKARAASDLNRVGGGGLKITMFYANPASVARGEATELCYGVAFAEKVEIVADPPVKVEETWPSLRRCVAARPKAATEFTLKAWDGEGREVRESIRLAVD